MEPIAVVVLAAGLGKRMGNPSLPKVLTETRERPIIEHVLLSIKELEPERIVVVTGFQRELVEDRVRSLATREGLPRIVFAYQDQQLGTGHAALCALPALEGFKGSVVIVVGDAPLIRAKTLKALVAHQETTQSTVTILSVVANRHTSYGRVIRSKDGKQVERVIELRDCSPDQAAITEVNAGFYSIDSAFIGPVLNNLTNENAQKEYYLTDVVSAASEQGQNVTALVINDLDEVQGINTQEDLALVNRELRGRLVSDLMNRGIQFEDPSTVYVSRESLIDSGVKIGPNVHLIGKCIIGANTKIEGDAYLINTTIGANAHIKFSVRSEEAIIGESSIIGPFANLRPGTQLSNDVKIGNFVETKKAIIGSHTSASHLTYLGDCEIGDNTNIGAGTITCNYDGKNKFKTTIGNDVFIGSDTALVAPVTVEDGATIGAGSVITQDVPGNALALTRAPQVTKANYIRKSKRD